VKSNINSVEVHPQLSNNSHPVDGALVGSGSLWPSTTRCIVMKEALERESSEDSHLEACSEINSGLPFGLHGGLE
jgi:hypothetical protein